MGQAGASTETLGDAIQLQSLAVRFARELQSDMLACQSAFEDWAAQHAPDSSSSEAVPFKQSARTGGTVTVARQG